MGMVMPPAIGIDTPPPAIGIGMLPPIICMN